MRNVSPKSTEPNEVRPSEFEKVTTSYIRIAYNVMAVVNKGEKRTARRTHHEC